MQLCFQGLDKGEEVLGQAADAAVLFQAPYLTFGIAGEQVSDKDPARKTLRRGLQGSHQIEAQKGQISQVVLRQRLAFQMRVDAAQAGEPAPGAAKGAEVGNDDFFVVTDDSEVDLPLAVNDDAYLASDF